MNVMLDTCALLWLVSGDQRLSRQAREVIDGAGVVYVSVMSGFEVALKWRRGKLILPANADEWFAEVVRHHGLELIALSLEDAMRAPSLPDIHRDPCDRFILAAALRLGVAVVTGDRVFAEYGVRVIE